jgi:hypothetical protein
MIWTKCLSYLKRHKLAALVLAVILFYNIARIAHLDTWIGHFELFVEPILDVMVARYTGGSIDD